MDLNYIRRILRWVSVDAGVPSTTASVLVCSSWGVPDMASFDNGWSLPDRWTVDSITHWAYIEVPNATEREVTDESS